jgi:hypothetical protein
MPEHDSQSFPSFVEPTESRYGQMLYPVADQYVGSSFRGYGEFSEGGMDLFRRHVQPGSVVHDIGANIGAHTVPLA